MAEAQSRASAPRALRAASGEPSAPGRVIAAASRTSTARTSEVRTSAARTSERAPARVEPPCVGPTVEVRRANGGYVWRGALVDCHGRVRAEALAGLAAIASPQAGANAFAPDLAALATEIRRVAPVAGWSIAAPVRERNRSAPAARCPAGQEPVVTVAPAASASAGSAAVVAGDAARASSASRRASGRRTRAARVQCRVIEVSRDAHTHDAMVEVDRRVRVVHPRLIEMLAQVAQRWPGRAIEVVSGYRPSSDPRAGSRHAHARALDFRVAGVARETLRDFCRTLPLAGVGYYPHSVFVHLDVRDRAEGSARWTDYSEPGERPRYGHWPPSASDVMREVEHITQRVDALLEQAASREQ